MVDESNDPEIRQRRQTGMELTLADLFAQRRVSGRTELGGIVLYCLVTLLLIVYFLACSNDSSFGLLGHDSAGMICISHLLVVFWMSQRIFARRQYYFTVLRAIRRAQNYFRIADTDFTFLPSEMRNDPFPEGYGDHPEVRGFNNTGTWAWYYRRHIWLIGFNLVLVECVYECTQSKSAYGPVLTAGFINFVAFIAWFCLDHIAMKNRIEEERGLVGASEDDYPRRETQPSP